EAARHDRVALEMAGEEPEIRFQVEGGARQAPAVLPAGLRDLRDPVEHQHRRQGQLRVARAEQFSSPAGEQILVLLAVAPLLHQLSPPGAWKIPCVDFLTHVTRGAKRKALRRRSRPATGGTGLLRKSCI